MGSDYSKILAYDPLAIDPTALDPKRYLSLNTTFQYEQPTSPTEQVPTLTYEQTTEFLSTVGSKTTADYTVGFQTSGSTGFGDLVTLSLKNNNTWGWTYSSSQSTTSGDVESATVTIGGPGFGYNGPTVLDVYYDILFKTFAFALEKQDLRLLSLGGTLYDAEGNTVAGAEIFVLGSQNAHTFTNAKGKFAIAQTIYGPCTIQASTGPSKSIDDCSNASNIELRP